LFCEYRRLVKSKKTYRCVDIGRFGIKLNISNDLVTNMWGWLW
jgi:hypothetical protein